MPQQKRVTFVALALIAIPLGLASRQDGAPLPRVVAEHAGDAIWAAFVYCGISICSPNAKVILRVALTLAFAFSIEFSQLYHAPWLDSIRETTLGGLVLGEQFIWIDLLRYMVGAILCGSAEAAFIKRTRQPPT
ncbi:MAG: DUF2809 domain-containing protein [Rubripirellula sp.]|nr:DUF2809 domain-containing protein [Rubripirellula sp.]